MLRAARPLAPDWITAPLIWTGTAIALAAKLSLRRSFGLVPANRGVKKSGAYRFVRHPMYTGYVLNHIGFLMLFFSVWNLVIYATCWVLLYLRAIEEERFLLQRSGICRLRQYGEVADRSRADLTGLNK